MKKLRIRKHHILLGILIGLWLIYGVQVVMATNRTQEITILGYHHIVEDDAKQKYFPTNMWVNSMSSFEAQMKLLKEQGYHSITLDELYEWRMGTRKLDAKSVVITFDDGFYSSIHNAQPILDKYGFSGSVFVVGSQIDPKRTTYDPSRRQHASLQDMKDVKGMEFYSHTYDLHHKDGDFRVNQLTAEELKQDVDKEKTLVSTKYVAYPYGKYNATIQQVLQEHGTVMAFGFNENCKASRQDDVFALPRFNVNAYTKLDVFAQMLR